MPLGPSLRKALWSGYQLNPGTFEDFMKILIGEERGSTNVANEVDTLTLVHRYVYWKKRLSTRERADAPKIRCVWLSPSSFCVVPITLLISVRYSEESDRDEVVIAYIFFPSRCISDEDPRQLQHLIDNAADVQDAEDKGALEKWLKIMNAHKQSSGKLHFALIAFRA
ncbi:hypothetical protein BJ322DRAFT_1036349 [Thelephora terrestris]|uniref:Uncharacterized protein n=1 Tax=Thelephora terrestris TaxID=56493 RepID=A0A9P6HM94_9AGAM|nr:hypothetical protein BJ322DRAFT_1036349 [Thelephora terrestris]